MPGSRHWTAAENLAYYFWLILNFNLFHRNKKKQRFFKQMSRFLNKDYSQCRTHHQKKLQKVMKFYGKEEPQLRNVYKFYFQNFKLRRLDEKYLVYELKLFLAQLQGDSSQPDLQKECRQYYSKVQEIVGQLQLDRNCESYNKTEAQCQTDHSDISKFLNLLQEDNFF